MYGEFQNKQLQSGQEYVLFVLAVVEVLENVSRDLSAAPRWAAAAALILPFTTAFSDFSGVANAN